MNRGFGQKYLLEKHPLWFVFGQANGKVDISDGNDIAVGIPEAEAAKIIEAHNKVVAALIDEVAAARARSVSQQNAETARA